MANSGPSAENGLPQAHVQQCGAWGLMKWSGWITEGPTRTGNWYAVTRKGIERKMLRALRRRERERAWREARARVLPSGGSDA